MTFLMLFYVAYSHVARPLFGAGHLLLIYSISTNVERVWYTSYTLFILAAHPHREVLIGSHGFLNHNSTLNLVHNPVISHNGV